MQILNASGSIIRGLVKESFEVKHCEEDSCFCVIALFDTGERCNLATFEEQDVAEFFLNDIKYVVELAGDVLDRKDILYPVIGSGYHFQDLEPAGHQSNKRVKHVVLLNITDVEMLKA